MSLLALCTGYAYGSESSELPKPMYNLYYRFGGEDKIDLQLRHLWHELKK